MKLIVFAICLFLLNFIAVDAFKIDGELSRVKRSNETEGVFKKVKDGVKSFGASVSNVAVKGYEEVKNLFSSKRKVGDYQINNIDVRTPELEEEDYEEAAVKKTKRDLVAIAEDIRVFDTTKRMKTSFEASSSFNLIEIGPKPQRENNAEESPGLPQAIAVHVSPLICKEKQKLVKGECRTVQ
jgi:hypothetical protein